MTFCPNPFEIFIYFFISSHWNYRSQRQMDGEKLWNYCSMVEKSTKQIKKWCNNMVNKNSKCKQQTAVLLFFFWSHIKNSSSIKICIKKNWMFKQSKNKLKPVHLPINQNYVIFFLRQNNNIIHIEKDKLAEKIFCQVGTTFLSHMWNYLLAMVFKVVCP